MSHLNVEQFKNNTVSPNQLAFQGMERGAHPTAALARKGYSFKIERERKDDYGPTDTYHLSTHHDAIAGEAASLTWSGPKDGEHREVAYPGEIRMVHTMPAHQRQGLATALYRHASDTNLGQETRPVHSPVLTARGAAWSRSVGGPGHVGGYRSDAPDDYHPGIKPPEDDWRTKQAKAEFHDRRMWKAGHRPFPEMDTA